MFASATVDYDYITKKNPTKLTKCGEQENKFKIHMTMLSFLPPLSQTNKTAFSNEIKSSSFTV